MSKGKSMLLIEYSIRNFIETMLQGFADADWAGQVKIGYWLCFSSMNQKEPGT